MLWRGILLTALFGGLAGCSATPASFGITGPGGAGTPVARPTPASDDAAVGLPGLPDSGGLYSPTLRPAGDLATPGSFYGYN